MRTHRQVVFGRHQHHGQDFIHATQSAGVDLHDVDGTTHDQLFEDDAVLAHLAGEVPITDGGLVSILGTIRAQGYLERDSAQSFGVVDISFPILGPDMTALATLTCPYFQRIDRHVGPSMPVVRDYLRAAAAALSLTQGMGVS